MIFLADLADLKLAVPMKSRAADWMYDQECVARLKSNHRDRWMSGKKLSAVTEVLSVYEGILEEEYHLSSSALIAITTTAKNYLGGHTALCRLSLIAVASFLSSTFAMSILNSNTTSRI